MKRYEKPEIIVTLKPDDVFWLREHYPNQWIAYDEPSQRQFSVNRKTLTSGKRRRYINTALLTEEVADLMTVALMEDW